MEKEVQSLEDRLHRFGEEGTPDKDSGSLKDRIPGKEKVLRVEVIYHVLTHLCHYLKWIEQESLSQVHENKKLFNR